MMDVIDSKQEVVNMELKPWQKADERKEKSAYKRGNEEGVRRTRADTVRFMANSTGVTDGAIAEYLSVPVSEVPAIREKYRNE